jgi:uncharacterized membrane protein
MSSPVTTPPAPPAGGGTYDEKTINDGKAMAVVGYIDLCCLMPLFLIPLYGAKENPYAQFHAKQGAVLYVAIFAASLVAGISQYILPNCVSGIITFGLIAPLWVLAIIGIINAMQGQAKELPVIGAFSKNLPL